VARIRSEIEKLVADGLRPSEIARRLSLAGPTVEYHIARLEEERYQPNGVATGRDALRSEPSAVCTRQRVEELLGTGLSRTEIARQVGVTKATVAYHARRLGASIDDRCARRYDWSAVQRFYDAGHSLQETRAHFGFSGKTWHEAVKRGAVVSRPAALPLEDLLVAGTYRGRHNLKLRLIKEGVKEERCEACGISEWRGQPLSFALHHINGDRHDNRLLNLELLCGNCHSQTATFAGRNWARRRDTPSVAGYCA